MGRRTAKEHKQQMCLSVFDFQKKGKNEKDSAKGM